MPPLRQREQTLRAELQAIADQASDALRSRAWQRHSWRSWADYSTADTLDVIERQRIVRLAVKEILTGDDNIKQTAGPIGGPAVLRQKV
jgi:site-specific DNA recombinase